MRILVTGGTGFIGSNVVEKLLQKGHDVAVYDANLNFINKPRYYQTALEHRKKQFTKKPTILFEEDIRDEKALREAFMKFKPEVVAHLAGISMSRPLDQYSSHMVPINLDGTMRVLDVFETSPSTRRIIYTSSSMAYGHFTQTPQPEEVTLNPINVYGATKAAGEYFVKLSKKEWVILRPTSVYGYTDACNRVTQLLIDAAITGKPVWVVRGETLDFSYVDDVAEGFVRAIESPSAMYQTFNISRGEPRAAVDFAEILKGYFPNFSYEVREPSSQQVFRGALDISKAKKMLGYEPKYSIEDGIKEILAFAKKYKWKAAAYGD